MIARTDRLFTVPSFISGFARVLDLGATFNRYNISRTAEEADMKAVASDWGVAVGDFTEAAERVVLEALDAEESA